MSARTELLERTRAERRRLEDVLARVGERWEADLGDDWRPRDVLAHLAVWERIAARRIRGEKLAGGDLIEVEPWDMNVFNDAMRDRWRVRPIDALRAESAAAHRELLAAIEAAPDDACGEGGPVREAIDDDGAGHYPDHIADLERLFRA